MSRNIKGLLIDLDGVIYNDNRLIPGAVNTIRELRKLKIPFRFITNTTMKCRETILVKLKNFGIQIETNEIFSAAYAAARYVSQFPNAKCHLMLLDDAKKEFYGMGSTDLKVDFVVAGDLGKLINFNILNDAFIRLMEGAELIALQKNRYWLSDRGLTLDAGAFIALLEYASNKQAVLIGKPEKKFFELALNDLKLSPQEVLMIGDDIESDIGGAAAMKINTCLVQTGKYRKAEADHYPVKPDYQIPSIAEVLSIDLF